MKVMLGTLAAMALAVLVASPGLAQDVVPQGKSANMEARKSTLRNRARHMTHMDGLALSFKQLQTTVAKLVWVREATAKYRDVRVAERDGYQAIGPYVSGMGVHYVRSDLSEQSVDLEHPPILLYEKNPKGPEGYRLAGVSYLLNAPATPAGNQ